MKWAGIWVSEVSQGAKFRVSCACNCLVIPCAIVGNSGPVHQNRRVEAKFRASARQQLQENEQAPAKRKRPFRSLVRARPRVRSRTPAPANASTLLSMRKHRAPTTASKIARWTTALSATTTIATTTSAMKMPSAWHPPRATTATAQAPPQPCKTCSAPAAFSNAA